MKFESGEKGVSHRILTYKVNEKNPPCYSCYFPLSWVDEEIVKQRVAQKYEPKVFFL